MHKYCLDVTAADSGAAADRDLNRLLYALDAIASIHGGKVLAKVDDFTTASYHRQCTNLLDCENDLVKELDWLRKEFPNVLFGLAEMMTTR